MLFDLCMKITIPYRLLFKFLSYRESFMCKNLQTHKMASGFVTETEIENRRIARQVISPFADIH